eukprot:Filipodium_phascolosomae@DN5982_c0_g1_i1.p1
MNTFENEVDLVTTVLHILANTIINATATVSSDYQPPNDKMDMERMIHEEKMLPRIVEAGYKHRDYRGAMEGLVRVMASSWALQNDLMVWMPDESRNMSMVSVLVCAIVSIASNSNKRLINQLSDKSNKVHYVTEALKVLLCMANHPVGLGLIRNAANREEHWKKFINRALPDVRRLREILGDTTELRGRDY